MEGKEGGGEWWDQGEGAEAELPSELVPTGSLMGKFVQLWSTMVCITVSLYHYHFLTFPFTV